MISRFTILLILTLLLLLALSCDEKTTYLEETDIKIMDPIAPDVPDATPINTQNREAITEIYTTSTASDVDVGRIDESAGNLSTALPKQEFTMSHPLCEDNVGPDCSALRLGDDYLSTSGPRKGYLYSCNDKNPNAPGSTESKITWINFDAKTWSFMSKLWLPAGMFTADAGLYEESVLDSNRHIEINNMPLDAMIGDWPMTQYPLLTQIDRNPGIPAPRTISLSLPVSPSKAITPLCVSLGGVGVTKNGVLIYNGSDARGEDALAREIVDEFGGHPAKTDYHYHFIPHRLDDDFLTDGHSNIVGYINDGFPIHGYMGEGGIEMSNKDLDECHGHEHGNLGYHYHATLEYPYTIGCYKGVPTSSDAMERLKGLR